MKAGISALPAADPDAPATLVDAAKVVLWGLVFWGGEQLAAAVFERNATAMAAAQAAVAEWGAGRMRIAWSDPHRPVQRWPVIGQRIAIGSALGFGCGIAVVVVALTTHAAVLVPGAPSSGVLVVGGLVAALVAVRDELLLRGVIVRATRLLPLWATLLACGLAAAAARFGTEGKMSAALALEAFRGVALGALWIRDRGAWMACAANAAWAWATGPVMEGGLLDLRFANAADAAGPDAFAVIVAAAMAASFWAAREAASPRPSR